MANSIENSILNLFSIKLRTLIANSGIHLKFVQEIRLRCGQPLIFILNGVEQFMQKNGSLSQNRENAFIVELEEIRETMEYISNYSMYAFEEELRQGFITVAGGHRVGICGKAVMENGALKTIKYISFINIRIAHEVKGCSLPILEYLYQKDDRIYNTLVISPPMHGKTTLLRDMVRNVSNGIYENDIWKHKGITVGLADERSEIAASYLGVPQNEIGIRTDVMDAMPKTYGIMMLIRTMSPKVVAVDEIGSPEDVAAILYGINCGCSFLATIHGESIEDIVKKQSLQPLIQERIFQRYLLLKKDGRGLRMCTIYDENFNQLGGKILG